MVSTNLIQKRRIMIVAIAAVALLTFLLIGQQLLLSKPVRGKPTSLVENASYEFYLVTDSGVKLTRFSELLAQGRPLILEVTYIGCASCEVLHSTGILQEIYSKHRDEIDLLTLFVYNDSPEAVRHYKEQFKLNWPYQAYLNKGSADFLINMKISTFFTHIFYDKEGVERYRNYGQINFIKENYDRIIELLVQGRYQDIINEFGEPIPIQGY